MSDDGSDFFKIIGQSAYGFFKAFLKEKQDSVSRFFVKNKVGFLPPGMDYSVFQRLRKKTSLKQLKFLIGNHHTLPIVMVGLWINSLNEDEQLVVADENRDRIYRRYKQAGINILNMCTTGFMEGFIRFLSSYNIKKNLSREELIDTYESTLQEWSRITIFVKKESTVSYVEQKCKSKINESYRFFYMFASYSARKIAKEALKKLSNEGFLRESGYEISREKINPSGSSVVWIFERQSIK